MKKIVNLKSVWITLSLNCCLMLIIFESCTIMVIIKMLMRGICLHLITNQFQVVIPRTYSKYTSRRVLTTEWIDGEKLSQSKESNVGELVNVGVICYLKQVIHFFNAFSWYYTALGPVSFKLFFS